MIRRPHLAAFATAVAALACSSSLDPQGDLVGHWATASADLSPQGWHQHHLVFTSMGSYRSEVRMYGLLGARSVDELSAYSREEGRFRVEGDRLIMEARRLVVWDRFYGTNSSEQVYEPYPYGTAPFDGALFEIQGERLILDYVTYPADGPVPTTREYGLVR